MTKDEIVDDYLRGKINLTEARKLLDKLEGKRLVDLIDGVKQKTKHAKIQHYDRRKLPEKRRGKEDIPTGGKTRAI